MDLYHVWCDLAPGVGDLEFVNASRAFLERLRERGALASYRITRRKLGLGHPEFGEFHLQLEFTGLAQLDEAFGAASERTEPIESFHHAVNSKVRNVKFALYRDFPDSHRQSGQERF